VTEPTPYEVQAAVYDTVIRIDREDSVRDGWYRATCDLCDWYTTGSEPVVEEAANEHIGDQHAMVRAVARNALVDGRRQAHADLRDDNAMTEPREAIRRVWYAAVDAVSSRDFRDSEGELDEAAYLRYQTNVIDKFMAEVWTPAHDDRLRDAAQAVVDRYTHNNPAAMAAAIPALRDALERRHHDPA
jgi:hypothetical protein